MTTEKIQNLPDKWAILIGVEHYEQRKEPSSPPRLDTNGNEIEYRSLGGCINDVLAIEQYLLEIVGINPENIEKLLAPRPLRTYISDISNQVLKEPSYTNISRVLRELPKKAKAGDLVYVHFSGHGARATTVFPSLKKDKLDEALVPSDITGEGKYLRDLELGFLLKKMVDAGIVVTLVLDCCYSGGAIRGDDGETRAIAGVYDSNGEKDMPDAAESILELGPHSPWMRNQQDFVVLAACQEHQTAKEVPKAQTTHGVLTYWLLETLRNGPLDLASQSLYDRVRTKVEDSTSGQSPYLLGNNDRFFFSNKRRPRNYTLKIKRVSVGKHMRVIDRHLYLDGGAIHGVQPGSEYAILSREFDLSEKFVETDILARVRVSRTGVTMSESVATFLDSQGMSDEIWDKIQQDCPAVLQKLPNTRPSTVRFSDQKTEREFMEHSNDNRTWLRLAEKNENAADFTIDVTERGHFKIHDHSGNLTETVQNSLKSLSSKESASLPALIGRLEHLARFTLTKSLANTQTESSTEPSLISWSLRPAAEGDFHPTEGWIAPAEVKNEGGLHKLTERKLFTLSVTNHSEHRLGCVVLDCAADLSIAKVYPSWGPFQNLEPGGTEEANIFMMAAQGLGASSDSFVDTLKIFVCHPPKDLDALQLPGLLEMENGKRNGGENESWQGLDNLLNELDNSRTAALISRSKQLDWETADVIIEIRPQYR